MFDITSPKYDENTSPFPFPKFAPRIFFVHKKTILRLKTGATTHALCYAKFRYRIRNGLFYDTIIRVFINMFVIYARGGAMQCGLDNASKTMHQERAKNFALL